MITSSRFFAEDQQTVAKVYKSRNRRMTAMRRAKSQGGVNKVSLWGGRVAGPPQENIKRLRLYISHLLYCFKICCCAHRLLL